MVNTNLAAESPLFGEATGRFVADIGLRVSRFIGFRGAGFQCSGFWGLESQGVGSEG